MDRFWEFLKKNQIAAIGCVIGVLFAVVGVPLLINWAFTVPALCDFFAVDWNAKDALSYYGSALGFIGTVIFSGLALWQNHVIKTESDKHTQLLEQMEQKKNMPILCFDGGSCSGNCSKLSLNIRNISDNAALEILVSRVSILNQDGSEFWSNNNELKIRHLINDTTSISLNNPPLTDMEQIFTFNVSYKDKFEKQHMMIVEGKQVGDRISFPRFFTKEV